MQEVSVKTKQGYRAVNIEPALVQMLTAHLAGRKEGRVFQTRLGTPFCTSNVRRKLNQILKKLKLEPAGLHAFRHGRVSVLQQNGVQVDLVKEWVGHSNLRTTSRYTHFGDEFRKQIACDVAIFSQAHVAGNLRFSPNECQPVGRLSQGRRTDLPPEACARRSGRNNPANYARHSTTQRHPPMSVGVSGGELGQARRRH